MGSMFSELAAFATAYLLDWVIGDPPRIPHPVRLLGRVIVILEKAARRMFASPAGLKLAGLMIALIAAATPMLVVFYLLGKAYALHVVVGWVLETCIIFTVLAGGDLHRHVARVGLSLRVGSLSKARLRVAMLVGRDTERLDENGISRAALESLFENSADGLVAPLFFFALGGAPLAVFYKAVSTLDSMIGYKTERHFHLGYISARLDDLLNYFPARLTALFIVLVGAGKKTFLRSLGVLWSDRLKHESPNSAWPEAAGAGVLGVRLGGPADYGGHQKQYPLINATGKNPDADDIFRGLALFRRLLVPVFTFFLVVRYLLLYWRF